MHDKSNDSGFQLSGSAPENYERYVKIFLAPFVEAILQRANIEAGNAVLDLACGTGFVAREASGLVGSTGRVAGLDINASMLEVARAVSTNSNPPIEWHQASAEEMPFEDAIFNALLCSHGIMFFPDLQKVVNEMCRVTASGGRIVASFWAGPMERSPYMEAARLRLEKALAEGSVGINDHGWRLDREETAAVFRDSGFEAVIAETIEEMVSLPPVAEFLPGHIASLPCANEFEALEPAARQRLYNDVTNDLAAYIQGDGTLLVPFVVHVVAGTRQ